MLQQSGIVRQDIRSSFGTASATAEGVPMRLKLLITDLANSKPFAGVAVYVWHCDRECGYSLYSDGITEENYLRGVQIADVTGTVTSTFPACYAGRWPHVHFEVYPEQADITDATKTISTSQLALPRDVCDEVYAVTGCSASVPNLAQVSLADDNVFGDDGGALQTATVTGDVTAGYDVSLAVGVDTRTTPSSGGAAPGVRVARVVSRRAAPRAPPAPDSHLPPASREAYVLESAHESGHRPGVALGEAARAAVPDVAGRARPHDHHGGRGGAASRPVLAGRPARRADRAGPHAVRSSPVRAVHRRDRGARLPGGDGQLPGHVRVRRDVGAVLPRGRGRPRHPGLAGRPAVVRARGLHLRAELSGADPVGGRGGPVAVAEGDVHRHLLLVVPRSGLHPRPVLLELSTAWTQTLEYQEDGVAAQLRRRIGGQRRTAEASGVLPVSAVDRALVGHELSYYADWVNHEPPSEDYWSPIDFSGAVASMPPVSMVAGWYDCFVHQQLDDFVALQSARRPARITIGPWKHVAIPGMLALVHDAVEAFDQLRDGRFDERARVRLYVMGSHQWRDFDHWPPVPDEVRIYHLGARENLSRTEATGGRSRFTYAPLDPTPSAGGRALDGQHAGPHDQHLRESRSDVLCFTSEPMAAPTTVIGRPRFRVTVRTSAEHADLVVRLCDVTGSRSVNICDGIAVISPQTVDRDADGSFTVELELDPTAHTFVKGHRIRLQVSGGAHPLTVRNLGLGEALATGRRSTSNKFEVAHVGAVLSLPLVP